MNKAGSESRIKKWDGRDRIRLSIEVEYFDRCISLLLEILGEIKSAIAEKFAKQTRVNIFKDIWEFLFKSKIMNFSDWIEVDVDEDRIVGWKKENIWYDQLANSEKIFIDFISENFMLTHPPKLSEDWKLSYPILKSLDTRHSNNLNYLVANGDRIIRILQIE
jgi:hypothetical protein